ncbi:hypothetical protein C7974DRAFT_74512 [Boeremia exigua]|uniref:uncharacterized protein n=1 Tax=Boeremia exigua TaxID=749465 RepID=UPI001E8D8DB7|nr:uncharacterized protein C7974DRAFT_74512 [Boeremia exigua]KAH6612962.1 hypothetical protein C7974DRAFT_74512 [Boeremia exigua]
MGDLPLQRWSKSDWVIFLGSQGPAIPEIIECLGLSHTTGRGIPKFSERESRKLSNEVQKLSQTLSNDLDALLKSASNPDTLDKELDTLLSTHGPVIWGESADRRRLLIAPGNPKTNYPKELFYEVPVDRKILKIHLHRWIYKEAYTRLPPRKLTRQSAACDLRTNPDTSTLHLVIGTPASSPVEVLRDEDLTGSTITPPVHAMAQQNGSTKRKVDARYSVPSSGNNSAARKRPRQNAAMSAEQSSREPSSTPRQSSENIPYTPTSDNTYLLPPATYTAVNSLAAISSGRPSALPSPHSRCVPDGTPRSTSSPTSTFVAVNQVQTSVSTGADGSNTTSTHTAPSLSEISVQSMAPNTSNSREPLGASLLSDSQRERGHGDTRSTHALHGQTPPAAQVMITYPENSSANHATGVVPLSPTGVSALHPTMGRTIDHQNGSGSNQMPGLCEVTLLQCELLRLLLGYLFPRNGERADESALLHSLEQVWASHEQDFRLAMERLFECHREGLLIWISERRKTSQLQLMIERQPSVQTLGMVDRVLTMNDLRILRLKWKELKVHNGSQDISAEGLLCSTFAIMTKTEGTEVLFKEGLDKLKETSPEVLRRDDLAISI